MVVMMLIAIVAALLAGIWTVGLRRRLDAASHGRFPLLTLGACVLVAVPGIVQVTVAPGLLAAWQRNDELVGHGQVWRLGTALLVQDGWTGGLIFNLVVLALVGSIAEQIISRWHWALYALTGALVGGLAGLAWQPTGGGNSIAFMGLIGGLGVEVLLRRSLLTTVPAVVSLAACVVLVFGRDLHGAAALGAAAVAGGLALRALGRSTPRPGVITSCGG